MNLQYERIQQACEDLKLGAIAREWSAIADHSAAQDQSLADFLEALLKTEISARIGRTQSALLKFAGLPVLKRFEDYDFNFATGAPKNQLQGFLNAFAIFLKRSPSRLSLNSHPDNSASNQSPITNTPHNQSNKLGDNFKSFAKQVKLVGN